MGFRVQGVGLRADGGVFFFRIFGVDLRVWGPWGLEGTILDSNRYYHYCLLPSCHNFCYDSGVVLIAWPARSTV